MADKQSYYLFVRRFLKILKLFLALILLVIKIIKEFIGLEL
jgi:hypothetical protein